MNDSTEPVAAGPEPPRMRPLWFSRLEMEQVHVEAGVPRPGARSAAPETAGAPPQNPRPPADRPA